MRLFRRRAEQDPEARVALAQQVRQMSAAPAGEVARVLDGDDGLVVAAMVLREFADDAHAHLMGQVGELNGRTRQGFAVDRRNYRPLWRDAGRGLRWPLFELRCGFQPYAQIAGAATVVGARARRVVKVTEPVHVLTDLLEILDLTIAGWEFGRVVVDVHGAALAEQLIVTGRALHDAIGEPPPLPAPVRELMRRNNAYQVYEAAGPRVVGAFNPGKRMREVLLT